MVPVGVWRLNQSEGLWGFRGGAAGCGGRGARSGLDQNVHRLIPLQQCVRAVSSGPPSTFHYLPRDDGCAVAPRCGFHSRVPDG